MKRLEFYPSRRRLFRALALCICFFFPAISTAFQMPVAFGTVTFAGLLGEWVVVERVLGFLALALLSDQVGRILTSLIWRTPSITADEKGITVFDTFTPWQVYGGVKVAGARPLRRYLQVRGQRRMIVPRRFLPYRADRVAKEIIPFATPLIASLYNPLGGGAVGAEA